MDALWANKSYSESTTIPSNPRTSRPVGYALTELSTSSELDGEADINRGYHDILKQIEDQRWSLRDAREKVHDARLRLQCKRRELIATRTDAFEQCAQAFDSVKQYLLNGDEDLQQDTRHAFEDANRFRDCLAQQEADYNAAEQEYDFHEWEYTQNEMEVLRNIGKSVNPDVPLAKDDDVGSFRKTKLDWSTRQTAVRHAFDVASKEDVMIMVKGTKNHLRMRDITMEAVQRSQDFRMLASSWPSKEAEKTHMLVEQVQEFCIKRLAPSVRYLNLHILAHQVAIDGLTALGRLHHGTKDISPLSALWSASVYLFSATLDSSGVFLGKARATLRRAFTNTGSKCPGRSRAQLHIPLPRINRTAFAIITVLSLLSTAQAVPPRPPHISTWGLPISNTFAGGAAWAIAEFRDDANVDSALYWIVYGFWSLTTLLAIGFTASSIKTGSRLRYMCIFVLVEAIVFIAIVASSIDETEKMSKNLKAWMPMASILVAGALPVAFKRAV